MSISVGGAGGLRPRTATPIFLKLDSWIPFQQLGIPRYAAGGFIYQGKLYVVGGMTTGGRVTSAVETIDLSTGQRGYATSMPYPRAHYAGVLLNDKYYVIGGVDPSHTPTDTILVYDPASDTWSTLAASLPTPLAYTCGDTDGANIFVAGGMNDQGDVVGTTIQIDPAAPSTAQKSDMNTPRENHACGILGGKLYVFGGDNGSGGLIASIEQYDPATDTWTTLSETLPEGLTGIQAARITLSGKQYILLIGG